MSIEQTPLYNFRQFIRGSKRINNVQFNCYASPENYLEIIYCETCAAMGIEWKTELTLETISYGNPGLLSSVGNLLRDHAVQHGDVANKLYKEIQKLKKQPVFKVILPPATVAPLEEISKHEMVDLLERAVMDGVVKDTILFQYEAFNMRLPPEVMAIILQYRYGKSVKVKIVEPEDDTIHKKRMIRPIVKEEEVEIKLRPVENGVKLE